MSSARSMISAVAFAVALTPLVGLSAFTYGATQDTAYLSTPSAFHQLATNSKGRPGEFQLAANSKGRSSEFRLAAQSKGRPNEFPTNTNSATA